LQLYLSTFKFTQEKIKVVPAHAIKVYRERGVTAPLILKLGTIIPTSQRRH
jgi:hypothetical protein